MKIANLQHTRPGVTSPELLRMFRETPTPVEQPGVPGDADAPTSGVAFVEGTPDQTTEGEFHVEEFTQSAFGATPSLAEYRARLEAEAKAISVLDTAEQRTIIVGLNPDTIQIQSFVQAAVMAADRPVKLVVNGQLTINLWFTIYSAVVDCQRRGVPVTFQLGALISVAGLLVLAIADKVEYSDVSLLLLATPACAAGGASPNDGKAYGQLFEIVRNEIEQVVPGSGLVTKEELDRIFDKEETVTLFGPVLFDRLINRVQVKV